MKTEVTTGFVEYEAAPDLVGRSWKGERGIATVTAERTPGGLYICEWDDGTRTGIRPAIIRYALANRPNA